MDIYVIPNLDKTETLICLNEAKKALGGHGARMLFDSRVMETVGDLADGYSDNAGELFREADIILVLGGDGTIIRAAKKAALAGGKPVLGVNLGRLGFIASIEASELGMLGSIAEGDFRVEERMMLDVQSVREDGTVFDRQSAINDAVISRGALSRIIDLNVVHDGHSAMSFRGDGVIISTPIGATGYALSAGGPVIDPSIDCITAVPVCPHSLRTRPIIFSADSVVSVGTGSHDRTYLPEAEASFDAATGFLAVDGEQPVTLTRGDSVVVRRADICARFIAVKQESFAEKLSEKFTTY